MKPSLSVNMRKAASLLVLASSPVHARPAPMTGPAAQSSPEIRVTNTIVTDTIDNDTFSIVNTPGVAKRMILWEYTLTHDFKDYPGIQESAASLPASPYIRTAMNWETWRPPELPASIIHRPMVRLPSSLAAEPWSALLASLATQPPPGPDIDKDKPIVHFYNEPELAGVTPTEALAAWRSHMLPLRRTHGVELVGPACASYAAGDAWHATFMAALLPDELPNYIGVHFYTSPDPNSLSEHEVDCAKNYIRKKYDEFGGRMKVVVSEIASTSRDPVEVKRFTRGMVEWMDRQGWVREFGFFVAAREMRDGFVGSAALLLDREGRWSGLGRYFAGFRDGGGD